MLLFVIMTCTVGLAMIFAPTLVLRVMLRANLLIARWTRDEEQMKEAQSDLDLLASNRQAFVSSPYGRYISLLRFGGLVFLATAVFAIVKIGL
jgi:hypothetical protein